MWSSLMIGRLKMAVMEILGFLDRHFWFLHVKLKNPNVDRMPEVGEVMTFSFEIDLENSVY